MIGVVVVTHGQLAIELLNAAEMIVGDLPCFTAVSIGWHEDVNDARADIEQAIERVRGDKGVAYGTVMRVMGRISAGGFRKVSLVTEVEDGG